MHIALAKEWKERKHYAMAQIQVCPYTEQPALLWFLSSQG